MPQTNKNHGQHTEAAGGLGQQCLHFLVDKAHQDDGSDNSHNVTVDHDWSIYIGKPNA